MILCIWGRWCGCRIRPCTSPRCTGGDTPPAPAHSVTRGKWRVIGGQIKAAITTLSSSSLANIIIPACCCSAGTLHSTLLTSHTSCTVLYCTVLYCTLLYCTVLYCTVLYCTVLYTPNERVMALRLLITLSVSGHQRIWGPAHGRETVMMINMKNKKIL